MHLWVRSSFMSKIIMKKILLLSTLFVVVFACAQAPDWVHYQTPQAGNNTYFYQVIAIDNATSLVDAQEKANKSAMDYGIKYKKNWVDVNTLQSTEGEMRVAVNLACPPYEENKAGKTIYYFLYQISKGVDVPNFDKCDCNSRRIQDGMTYQDKNLRQNAIKYIQTRAIPASVLCPGSGQMVKGQYLKGGLILGGEVIGVGGIITAFSQKSSYERLILEDSKHALQYADMADTWQNVGYGFIGLAAAVYVYSLIDVIATRPSNSAINKVMESLTLTPVYSYQDSSVGLAMQVKF